MYACAHSRMRACEKPLKKPCVISRPTVYPRKGTMVYVSVKNEYWTG